METYTSTHAYGSDFKTIGITGWGCGYVHIPKDHPILVKTLIEDDGWGNYLTPEGCPEEITYSSWDKEKEYFVIGFDTAHGYNNDSHDEAYVTSQANIIKSLVDSYTDYHANVYARKQIQLVTEKFNKYLL